MIPNDFYQNFDHCVHFNDCNRSEYYKEFRVGYFLGTSFRWKLITSDLDNALQYLSDHPDYNGYPLYMIEFNLLSSFRDVNGKIV